MSQMFAIRFVHGCSNVVAVICLPLSGWKQLKQKMRVGLVNGRTDEYGESMTGKYVSH